MAIYVVYRKAAETPTEVTYQYGGDHDDLDRSVVINKTETSIGSPDGTTDMLAAKVAGKALARMKSDGEWPAGGVIAS